MTSRSRGVGESLKEGLPSDHADALVKYTTPAGYYLCHAERPPEGFKATGEDAQKMHAAYHKVRREALKEKLSAECHSTPEPGPNFSELISPTPSKTPQNSHQPTAATSKLRPEGAADPDQPLPVDKHHATVDIF